MELYSNSKPTCCLRAGLYNQLGKMLLLAIISLILLLELLLLPSTMSWMVKEGPLLQSYKAILQGIIQDFFNRL